MASFGEGYRFHLTGLTHDEYGFPTAKKNEIVMMLEKLRLKTMRHLDELTDVRVEMMEDAHIMVVAYGSTARAARQAIRMARKKRFKVGLIQPRIIWPFPDKIIRKYLEQVDLVVVPELNQGQIIREVKRLSHRHTKIIGLNRFDGELITPRQIMDKSKEERP
jgi:2-oxoglutarate ferredoxin oxidoreductase subunit alpha